MRVSKERLSVIGRLIGIYREERRDNTQNEYTQKRFCDGICSPNTLKSIEAGGLSRSEDIYIELLDKLGLKYGEFPAIDEAIDEIVEEINHAIEFYDRKKIEILINKAMRILSKVNHYVYYETLYAILKNLQMYYMTDSLIDDEYVRIYTKCLPLNLGMFKDFIKILVYAKVKTDCITDVNSYSKLIESLDLENTNMSCLKINLLHYYLSCSRFEDMRELILVLEETFELEHNPIRLLDIYNCSIILSSFLNKPKIEQYIVKSEEILKSYDIPEIKICELYSNIASAYYLRKDYQSALNYYSKMFVYYDENYLPNFIYFADCQNRLGLEIDIPKITNESMRKFPFSLRLMYKYFTLGSDVPAFVKQNYIMKRILPSLEDPFLVGIFRYELAKQVEKTGHYKNMYLFDKIVCTR